MIKTFLQAALVATLLIANNGCSTRKAAPTYVGDIYPINGYEQVGMPAPAGARPCLPDKTQTHCR